MTTVQFKKYYVTNGFYKARVMYSVNNRIDGRKCVTLYAKDFSNDLYKIFKDHYVNDSDSQSDYFDEGRVNFFEDNAFYQDALKTATNS